MDRGSLWGSTSSSRTIGCTSDADEKGYFTAEGLDYEFQAQSLAGASKQTSPVQSADSVPAELRSGAFEDMSGVGLRYLVRVSLGSQRGHAAGAGGCGARVFGDAVRHLRVAGFGFIFARRIWLAFRWRWGITPEAIMRRFRRLSPSWTLPRST